MALPEIYVDPVGASIERWLASHPDRTATTYRESLMLAVRVMHHGAVGVEDVDWQGFDDAHLAALRESMLMRHGYAPATVNRVMAAIRSLAQRLRRDHLIDGDRLAALNSVKGVPRAGVRKRIGLTVNEQRLVWNACTEVRAPRFHRAILSLMLAGGLRSHEVIGVIGSRDPLVEPTGNAGVWAVKVMGKGRKLRTVYLRGASARDVACFVRMSDGDDRHGFYTPLTKAILVARCRELARKARVRIFTPHDLRRTFATNMLRRTDIVTVQKMMGHADPKQTADYDIRDEERMIGVSFDPWGEG
jgi:integrase